MHDGNKSDQWGLVHGLLAQSPGFFTIQLFLVPEAAVPEPDLACLWLVWSIILVLLSVLIVNYSMRYSRVRNYRTQSQRIQLNNNMFN